MNARMTYRRVCRRAFTFFLLLMAFARVASAASGALTRYEETILLEKDGSVTVRVQCNADNAVAGDTLLLPFAFSAWPESVAYDAKISGVMERNLHGRRQTMLTLAQAISATDTLNYSFHLANVTALGKPPAKDFGNYDLSYRAVNVAAAPIASYVVRVVLPPQMVVNTITSSAPARRANAAASPYAIEKFAGRHCVTLRDSTVLPGDYLALSFQAKSEAKSPFLIVLLTLIAGAYLWAFRDLVRPRQP